MGRSRGSVKPFGDGRWRAKACDKHLGIFDSEEAGWAAVRAYLAHLEDEENKSKGLPGQVLTMRVFFEEWLDARERAGVVRSVDRERSVFKQHIATAAWIDYPPAKVSRHHIQAWLISLLGKTALATITMRDRAGHEVVHRPTERTLSRKSVCNVRALAKACFDQAVIEPRTGVKHNPVDDVQVPKVAERVQEDEDEHLDPLHLDEVVSLFALLEACVKDQIAAERARDKPRTKALATNYIKLRAVLAVAIYCGLRDGELIGLRWRDIEDDIEEDPILKVRKSYDGPPKTKRARRSVPLLKPALEALRAWRPECAREQALRGITSELVFPSDHGGCYSKGYDFGWDDQYARADRKDRPSQGGKLRVSRTGWKTRAGIRPEVRWHGLRHTFGSHMAAGLWGMHPTPEELMKWMGHSDLKTTMRYVNLAGSTIRAHARKFQLPTAVLKKLGKGRRQPTLSV